MHGPLRIRLNLNIRFNTFNAELNPVCHLLSLLEAHHIFHVSRIRVNVKSVHFVGSYYIGIKVHMIYQLLRFYSTTRETVTRMHTPAA